MMITNIDKLTQSGCDIEKKDKACRSRGGESCAFDGAMIVLQPIADTAHIVHGPISCCGNSWEGRGALSGVGTGLHRMGFTTDMSEIDIVYGSEDKLYRAIKQTHEAVMPKAIFVYSTCVSGLTGEDIDSVCRRARKELGTPVIPVNAPGFVGPKNLGNRIAGEVLLDRVIGTGEPPALTPPLSSPCQGEDGWGFKGEAGGRYFTGVWVNLIGEYNIAGDLWLVEPVLRAAGIRILSRITGDSTFEEITYAHRAKLNLVVCSRALINVARGMEKKYGIPYAEVSFFGKTEMSKALRIVGAHCNAPLRSELESTVEAIVKSEETRLNQRLKAYSHLRGKKAVLYTGGVKSWSFISALIDLGIEVVAIGTKKSTFEDEEKMREILGPDAPLTEDTTPKNLLRLFRERGADMLIAGGRNQYLAVKEGVPFVDVNQERHTAYAGYDGLVNLADDISKSVRFYEGFRGRGLGIGNKTKPQPPTPNPILINPLKHSQALGAAIAFQGIDRSIPVIHGAQGCNFLGKVLLTKHFREPIALMGTKLFTEDVVMGCDESIVRTVEGIIEKSAPDIVGVLTTGLSEVKGDDLSDAVKGLRIAHPGTGIIPVSTPDYEGGLESGYARAVEALLGIAGVSCSRPVDKQINVLAGCHLTPADFTELREISESFGLTPLILPDLSALDGSRQGFSPLAAGGTPVTDIAKMGASAFTLAIGPSMENAATNLKKRFGIEYRVFEGLAGLKDTEKFMETLSGLSGHGIPAKYERQRRMLIDGMREAHLVYGNKKVCLALEPDLSLQYSRLLEEMGAVVRLAVLPNPALHAEKIRADEVTVGDLFSIEGDFDIMVSGSHAVDTAKRLETALYQAGFPVYKTFGNNTKITIGYRGALATINEIANLFIMEVH